MRGSETSILRKLMIHAIAFKANCACLLRIFTKDISIYSRCFLYTYTYAPYPHICINACGERHTNHQHQNILALSLPSSTHTPHSHINIHKFVGETASFFQHIRLRLKIIHSKHMSFFRIEQCIRIRKTQDDSQAALNVNV